MHNVTMELARFVVGSQLDAVSESERDEAVRALVNCLGCALGGSLDPAVDAAIDALQPAAGAEQATLIGRGFRADVLSLAQLGALSADVLNYGDTHPQLGIGFGAAVVGAMLPLAESRARSGAQVLHAFLLGVETACRTAHAWFLDRGAGAQETSAVCGAIGGATACAKLLVLDETRTAHAIGMAAMPPRASAESGRCGSRSTEVGVAARHGASAALLAAGTSMQIPSSPPQPLAAGVRSDAVLDGLGTKWVFASSAYHAYPCDYALHTTVEACLQLKRRHRLNVRNIREVVVRLHPGRAHYAEPIQPETAGDARRCLHHAAAVALLNGDADTRRFDQARTASARVKQLRDRVRAQFDPALGEDAASVSVRLHDDNCVETEIRSPLGGPQRPLSNAEISAKFRRLATDTLATDQAERLLALAWNIAALADVGALIRAGVPEDSFEPAELPGSPLLPR